MTPTGTVLSVDVSVRQDRFALDLKWTGTIGEIGRAHV